MLKLRDWHLSGFEEFINLWDVIKADGNAQNIGRTTILSETYVGSPRLMYEYAQDVMSYVRHYGTPDLIITLTCTCGQKLWIMCVWICFDLFFIAIYHTTRTSG